MKTTVLLMVLIATAVSMHGAETGLEALKQTYALETQKLDEQWQASSAKVLDAYGRALDAAIAALKREGDPDRVLAAIAEKKRFGSERTLPDASADHLPVLVLSARGECDELLEKTDAARDARVAELTARYMAVLDRLMKKLTTQEKLDLAINVKEEKQRVEFILADTASKLAEPDSAAAENNRQPLRRWTWGTGRSSEARFLKATGSIVVLECGNGRRMTVSRSALSQADRAYLNGIGAEAETEATKRPADAVPFENHWYKFFPENVGWNEASNRCASLGGYLACVTSRDENRFVAGLAGDSLSRKRLWLGATDQEREGRWKWISGERFGYANWSSRQPDNHRANQHFLNIWNMAAQWDDSARGERSHFVCEWDE